MAAFDLHDSVDSTLAVLVRNEPTAFTKRRLRGVQESTSGVLPVSSQYSACVDCLTDKDQRLR